MRPLVLAASAFLLGCAAGALVSLPTHAAMVAAAAGAALGAFVWSGRLRLGPYRLILLFTFAGAVAASSATGELEHGCAARLEDGAVIRAVGVLEALPTDRGTAPLRIAAALTGRRGAACRGVVRAKLPAGAGASRAAGELGAAAGADAGERGVGSGAAAGFREASTPPVGIGVRVVGRWWAGSPASVWPAAAERRGVLIVETVAPLDDAPPGASAPMLRLRGAVQRRLRSLFGERAGLVEALVLARGEQVDQAVRATFVDAGLAHLLAISGTHVGLIAGALLLLLRAARLRPDTAAWSAAAGTLAYVAFIGAPHAAARAAVQITLLIASRVLQRPADAYALLAAAAFVIAGSDPLAPLEPGFQLSFAGILGIIAARRPLLERMPRRLPRWLRDGLATGVAASLATMPIAALHFGQLATIGVAATLAAVPVLALAVPGIGLALISSFASSSIGGFLADGTAVLLDALVRIATIAGAVPGGHAYVTRHAVLSALAALAAAILAGAMLRERARSAATDPAPSLAIRPFAARAAIAVAAVAVLLLAPALAGGFGAGRLEIHAIDVGQGDAIAVRSPAGRWILIDTGPRSISFDAGRARVLPFLRDHGVRRLDAMILTHPDADHIGGAAAILDAVEVGLVVDPAIPAGKNQYLETLDAARRGRSRWLAARAGRELRFDDVTIEFLAPDTVFLDDRTAANDYSVVFRLEYGAFAALFLGDAPVAVEERVVRGDEDRFAASLLKVGHHGSRTSTGDSLLDTMRPDLALLSVGRRNRYGHPDPMVLRRLHARGITVLRTDEHGTIRIRVDRAGRVDVAGQR